MSRARRMLLPTSRALPCDLLYFAAGVPQTRLDRWMPLAEVSARRTTMVPRVSWAAVFLRAYGLISEQIPVMRQTYITWPIPHLVQHEQSVAMMAIHREEGGQPRLCWGRFVCPAEMSLPQLQQAIDRYQSEPIARVFRKQVWLSRFPRPLRRLLWWAVLHGPSGYRARQVGTFSLSTLAGQGATNRDFPNLLTSGLSYGPIEADGRMLVTLVFDHRVMDGVVAARILRRLEDTLQSTILDELSGCQRRAA